MKFYKYILLDWDGNLVNSLPIWLRVYHQLAEHYNIELSDQDITTKLFGKEKQSKLFHVENDKEYQLRLKQMVNDNLKDIDLFEGVEETLQKLKQSGKKLCVVSTNYKFAVLDGLKRNGIEDLIDGVIAWEDISKHKPDPEAIYKGINLIGGNKERSIMIGDGENDVGAGKNAGIATVLYYPEINHMIYSKKYVDALKADFVIEKFEDLIEIIN